MLGSLGTAACGTVSHPGLATVFRKPGGHPALLSSTSNPDWSGPVILVTSAERKAVSIKHDLHAPAIRRTLIACAIAGIHLTAWGAETALSLLEVRSEAIDPNGRIDLDSVNATGSKLGLTAREMPAAVNVVTREQIEARGALDTQEIARGIPGLTNASPLGSAGSCTASTGCRYSNGARCGICS